MSGWARPPVVGRFRGEDLGLAGSRLVHEHPLHPRVVLPPARRLQETEQLRAALREHMHDDAPGFRNLDDAVKECQRLVQELLRRKAPAAAEEEAAANQPPTANGSSNGPAGGTRRAVASREQAYAQLMEAARVLRELEPHSPIPYLVDRAVRLGQMPFPKLIKALIRESSVLGELMRDFDISDEPTNE